MMPKEGFSNARILVVEDENIVALDIERGLKRLGYQVIGVVNNGREAIQMTDKHRPDLVLMDVQIKGDIDGIEAAKQIREQFNLPVIFLTAYADDATIQRAKGSEPFGYLLKPFEETELHTAIEITLHKYKAVEARKEETISALRASEETLRLFIDSVRDYAIVMLDSSGHVMTWNTGAERITGYKADEIVGKDFSVFYPQDEVAKSKPRQELETARAAGKFEEEGWRVRKDGSLFWGSTVITAIHDKDGRFHGFGKVTRDLTSKKKDEEAIKESEQRKSAILEGSLDCIISMNQNGQIIEFNRAAEQTFGWKREDVLGKEMAEIIIPPRLRERHRQGLALYLTSGHGPVLGKRIEMPAMRSDGTEFPVELSIVVVESNSRHVFTGFIRDITERKRAAEDLLAAKNTAESANLAKSAFLANMSHEIRTPLGAVIGFSELLADPAGGPSERVNFIAAIKRNGELLSNIISDILDLSKVEAGKMEVHVVEAALTEILTDTKTLLDLQAKEKGVSLNIKVQNSVPQIVRTDPMRLRQILINVIGNAIKFTQKGSVDVMIKLVPSTNGGLDLAFVVSDTGKGIKNEDVAKLFSPFSQADVSTKRQYGGTGLGLVLSRRLANILGGDIVLTSTEEGKGSTFTITVDPGPLRETHLEEFSAEKYVPIGNGGIRLDGIKVLLAEDTHDNQVLVSRLLKIAGATVVVASNGKEAVEKAKHEHFDVLLMDLQMPVMDGFEATAELRREGYDGKIVALTAHALNDEKQKCLASGFDDHLSKPINRNLLLKSVAQISKQQAFH